MLELTNIGLRGLALGSKFVLLFFLARFLPPAQIGLYGLVTASISYGVMTLGLDFYTYATRQMLSNDRNLWATYIRDQTAAYGVVYFFELPLFLFLFGFGVLPWELAGWFFALLVCEHIARELNRLLVVVGRPVLATVTFLFQSGFWVWFVLTIMFFHSDVRKLWIVFAAWIVGDIVAIAFGIFVGMRGIRWRDRTPRVNWSWIRKGIRVAAIFLVATLSLRGVFAADRIIVKQAAGLDLLGVYTFYIGMAMSATSFLDAGVFTFLYPRVVAAFRTGKLPQFRALMHRLWLQTAGVTAILLVIIALAFKPVLGLLNHPVYLDHLPVMWILLGVVALYALGMVPHYGLYAFGRDRTIMASHLTGFITFLGASIGLARIWPLGGVAVGLAVGMSTILGIKLACYLHAYGQLVGPHAVSTTAVKSGPIVYME
ncbi:MAG: hypothetical protein L0H29_01985 [Sinobacteraceae bacterium]|nr:hypothetical protein [Nevskiaceae bacterium]